MLSGNLSRLRLNFAIATRSETVDIFDPLNDSTEWSSVQIEMVAPQSGLEDRSKQRPDGLGHLSKCDLLEISNNEFGQLVCLPGVF